MSNGIKVTDLTKVEVLFGNELHLVTAFIDENGQGLAIPQSRSVELRKVAGFSNLIHSSLSTSVGFNTSDVPEETDFSLYDGGVLDLDEKINHFIFNLPYKNDLCFNLMIEYFVTVIYGNGYTANFMGNHTYIEINGQVLRQFTTGTTELDSTYPPSIFGNQNHGNALYLYRIPYSAPDSESGYESGRRFRVYWRGMPSSPLDGATVTTSLIYSANVTDSRVLCGFDSSRLYGFDSRGNQIDADINGLIAIDTTNPLYLIVNGNFLNDSPSNPKISVSYDATDFNGTASVDDFSPSYSPNYRSYTISLYPPDGGDYSNINGTLRVTFTYDCGADTPTVKTYEIAVNQSGNGGTGTTSSPTPTAPQPVLAPYWLSSGTSQHLQEIPLFEDIVFPAQDVYAPIMAYPNSTIDATIQSFHTLGSPQDQPVLVRRTPETFTVVFNANWYGFGTVTINIIDENANVIESQPVYFRIIQPS